MCKSSLEKYREYINKDEKELFEKVKKQHEHKKIRVKNAINKKSKVCFILSCPGKEEMIANALCQGSTGDNLNILLNILHEKKPDIFQSSNKEEYDILNATTVVHFKALDNKTEGTNDEILNDSKLIKNYSTKNKGLKFAILLGNKPSSLKNIFGDKAIFSRHLGFKSVNNINKDVDGNEIDEKNYIDPEERNIARINVIAKEII